MAPSLRIPVSVSMDQFESQMAKMGDLTQTVVKKMTTEFIKLNAEIAVQGVKALAQFGLQVGKVALQMGAMQAAMRGAMRLAIPVAAIGLVVESFRAMAAIAELARQKMEEFREVSEKAFAAGVSADFFQRWVKGAEAIKLSVEDATAALQKFADQSKSAFGGSALENRIKELKEAGNLQGNTGVGALGNAIGNQDKLQATVSLIDQMLAKGERLAALDLAERAFGPKVADNLRADAGYLDKILETAQKIEATKLIDAEQINNAVDLKNRIDEAQKILAEKWLPIQKDLVGLGIAYEESWVNFYQNLASAVTVANSLYEALKRIPDIFAAAGASPFWQKFNQVADKLGVLSSPESLGLTTVPQTSPQSPAAQALANAMKNPANIQRAMRETSDIQSKVRGDTSKPIVGKQAPAASEASAWDRANEQISKHIGLMNADTAAVGENAGEHEKLRTIALLEEAAKRDRLKITDEVTRAINAQAAAAGEAALKLAKAQHQLAEINDASREFGSALSDAFKGMVLEGKKLDEVLRNLTNRMASKAIDRMFDLIFAAGAGQSTSIFGALLKGFGGARAGGGSVSGGSSYLVGEHGPELFAPGQSGMVIPNQAIGRGRGGGLTVAPVYNIDASGADTAAVARLQAALIATNRSLESRALSAVAAHMARGA
jgi:hypothetical protein